MQHHKRHKIAGGLVWNMAILISDVLPHDWEQNPIQDAWGLTLGGRILKINRVSSTDNHAEIK